MSRACNLVLPRSHPSDRYVFTLTYLASASRPHLSSVLVLGTAQAAWDLLDKRSEIYSGRPRSIMAYVYLGREVAESRETHQALWTVAKYCLGAYERSPCPMDHGISVGGRYVCLYPDLRAASTDPAIAHASQPEQHGGDAIPSPSVARKQTPPTQTVGNEGTYGVQGTSSHVCSFLIYSFHIYLISLNYQLPNVGHLSTGIRAPRAHTSRRHCRCQYQGWGM